MRYNLTLTLAASLTGTVFGAFQAPLPEFKNEKQLAEWRAEKAAAAASQEYASEEAAFYTGKPYLASFGEYAFKYRSYSPELARWTSEDPSGFPDGANLASYAPTPTHALDLMGLSSVTVTGIPVSSSSGSNLSIGIVSAPQSIGAQGVAQGESVVSWSVGASLSGWIVQEVVFDYTKVIDTEEPRMLPPPKLPIGKLGAWFLER